MSSHKLCKVWCAETRAHIVSRNVHANRLRDPLLPTAFVALLERIQERDYLERAYNWQESSVLWPEAGDINILRLISALLDRDEPELAARLARNDRSALYQAIERV